MIRNGSCRSKFPLQPWLPTTTGPFGGAVGTGSGVAGAHLGERLVRRKVELDHLGLGTLRPKELDDQDHKDRKCRHRARARRDSAPFGTWEKPSSKAPRQTLL